MKNSDITLEIGRIEGDIAVQQAAIAASRSLQRGRLSPVEDVEVAGRIAEAEKTDRKPWRRKGREASGATAIDRFEPRQRAASSVGMFGKT